LTNNRVSPTVIFAFFLSLGGSVLADDLRSRSPRSIDVFTTESEPLESVEAFLDDHPETIVRIYFIDAIERLEDELSRGLSARSEQAKSQALERLQRLPKETRTKVEHTARALVLAMQLGITRYPAIVIDQQQVVLGVANITVAMAHYRSWQLAGKP
jgi:integrating conjugative element protein (TIGR03757 family)